MGISTMIDSASLKIDRAVKRIAEIEDLFRNKRPFAYMLETNTNTGERATYAKRNESVAKEAALIAGEAIHALRSALDHAYWEIVSPHANTDAERRRVQFPFTKEAARLEDNAKSKLADRVSPGFLKDVLDLKPYAEEGGNEYLYLIDELDVLDKHKLLIPIGDFTQISGEDIRQQVPDIPVVGLNMGFGMNRRDIVWHVQKLPADLGQPVPPTQHLFEKEINVFVEIIFATSFSEDMRPMIPTLHELVRITRETVHVLRTS